MAKTRMVNTRFWNDSFISQLDPIEKLLFIYFITNEHTNICGIYELPLKVAAIETGIDESMFKKVLGRLKPKIFYYEGWVIATNFPKHQSLDNPKIQKGIENEKSVIPQRILEKAIAYGYPIDRASHPDSDLDSDSNTNSNTTSLRSVSKKSSKSFSPTELAIYQAFKEFVNENILESVANRKVERDACKNLESKYGLPIVIQTIQFVLPKTNLLPHMPQIYTPSKLLEKWAQLSQAKDRKITEIVQQEKKLQDKVGKVYL